MGTLATPQGTAAYAKRHPGLPGHFRVFDGLLVSSIGLGTYLGDPSQDDDERYRESAALALESGVNLLDTAINYRAQRSERVLGEVLRSLSLGKLRLSREEVVVCTKAGFLPYDGTYPADGPHYLRRTYLESGLISPSGLVAGCHSIEPGYLRDQLMRSLRNLRLDAVDVFYLHNPETQLEEVAPLEFASRMRAAFSLCEELCEEGLIGRYGCATWNGLRAEVGARGHLSLSDLVSWAREVGGARHRFRVVQLPLSFAMTEALSKRNQVLDDGERCTLLQAAGRLGIAVFCSGPLSQGKVLARPLPERLRSPFPGLKRDSQRALHFVRSAPGVVAALCGMRRAEHVRENLALLSTPPLDADSFAESFAE